MKVNKACLHMAIKVFCVLDNDFVKQNEIVINKLLNSLDHVK